MSDTPETDAAILASGGQWNYVLRECARRLERERDEARDMVEKFTEQGLDLLDSNRTLKRERDAALDKISELKGVIQALRSNLRETSRETK